MSTAATATARIFPITDSAIYLVVTETAQAAGLGSVAPHDLRRTAAKLMLDAGASLEQISQILGHSSLATTQRYLGIQLELRAGKAAPDLVQFDEGE